MKHLLLILAFCLSLNTSHTQDLVSIEQISEISQLVGQLLLGTLGINVDLDNGTDIYRVTYTTTGTDMMEDTASGLIMLPQDISGPLPILIYQHGTTDGRDDVPSNLRGGYQLGAIFAGKGMAVVAPDFLGMGTSRGFHPYVHAETEATAAVDLVEALRKYMTDNEIEWNDQLFITGYSQGGHAAMAVHRYLEILLPDVYTVTASLPMSGPYSISGVMKDLAFTDEPYAFPAYLVYSTRALREVNPLLYQNEADIFKESILPVLDPFLSSGNGLFDMNESIVEALLAEYGQSIPKQMFKDSVLNILENDLNHPFNIGLRENDVFDWIPQAPVLMLYCESDDQVPFRNSVIADSVMNMNGAPNVSARDVSGGQNLDHSDCIVPALNAGIPWLLSFVDFPTPTVEVISSADLLIYPNPTYDLVNIEVGEQINRLEIYTIDGKKVLHQTVDSKQLSLNLASLDKGIYLVHMYMEDGVIIEKLVLQ